MQKQNTQMYEETVNLIIIGDAYVGKTSLMKRLDQ
jgi:GTPase SAR1 family protein